MPASKYDAGVDNVCVPVDLGLVYIQRERKECVYQSMFILHFIILCPPWSMLSI